MYQTDSNAQTWGIVTGGFAVALFFIVGIPVAVTIVSAIFFTPLYFIDFSFWVLIFFVAIFGIFGGFAQKRVGSAIYATGLVVVIILNVLASIITSIILAVDYGAPAGAVVPGSVLTFVCSLAYCGSCAFCGFMHVNALGKGIFFFIST
eukprot:gb/GECH01009407.1/.p1 GENE.gb/GECH01009407.1/~~gb/GECH01009407.1/.p1  ORF type:complete len:149 (+),score=5.86 gb/GECH01009407.1/:1-447(+)